MCYLWSGAIIDKATCKNVRSVKCRSGILYLLGKEQKDSNNELQPFHPILSAIGKLTQRLASFLLPFLKPVTENEYIVTGWFQFAEEICKQDPNL